MFYYFLFNEKKFRKNINFLFSFTLFKYFFVDVFLIIIILFFPFSAFAGVYPNDNFHLNNLCISNPWATNNWKPDISSGYPCHYDYAIQHVPTVQAEIAALEQELKDLQTTCNVSNNDLKDSLKNIIQSNKDIWLMLHTAFMVISLIFGVLVGRKH